MDAKIYQHLPKSFQTMLKIEELAQERLQQIKRSIEMGETTLEAVKRQRGLI